MTAGRGIVHSERSDAPVRARGGRVHGLQSWVALPDEAEDIEPSFAHHPAGDLPKFEAGGARGVLIAGTAYGLTSPVATFSPIFYVHLDLDPNAQIALPEGHDERAVYVVSGRIDADGTIGDPGHMFVFDKRPAAIAAADGAARVVLLGGASVGPRLIWWNLVASTRDRMEAAKADWRAGRMKLPPGDDREFIPLPEEPAPQPTDPV
jgi:redox-sensitive bicupin YhaK (pirin superfamily)